MLISTNNLNTFDERGDGHTQVIEEGLGQRIGNDKLFTINDVASTLSVCPETASTIIKETGHGINIHRRVYIFESSLVAFLKRMEAQNELRD